MDSFFSAVPSTHVESQCWTGHMTERGEVPECCARLSSVLHNLAYCASWLELDLSVRKGRDSVAQECKCGIGC